ncbi:hypothetical protein ACFLV4_07360 [Chloroflexota bacterium]
MQRETVLLRVNRDTRDAMKDLAGEFSMSAYLDDLIMTLAKTEQPQLESLAGGHTLGDVRVAVGRLEAKIDELAEKIHIIDARTWQAFLDTQKQIMQITVTLGLIGSTIEQVHNMPDFKQMLEDQGRPLAEQMFKEHCLKSGWNEVTEDEAPADSDQN